MTVENNRLLIDPEGFRWTLADTYEKAPGPVGAGAIVAMMDEIYKQMMTMYTDFIRIDMFDAVKRRMRRTLRPWRNAARAMGKRLDGYWTDSCLPIAPCPDEPQPEYTDEWVGKPVLDGEWPEEYYIGVPIPGRADAIELVMLWNQLMSVEPVAHMIEWDITDMMVELYERAEIELSRSAPGEEATFGDALANIKKHLDKFWEGLGTGLYVVGVGLVLIGGYWIYTRFKG